MDSSEAEITAPTADSAAESPVVVEEPFFSTLDIFLFTLIAGFAIYWFFFRKKKIEIPDYKTLQPQ